MLELHCDYLFFKPVKKAIASAEEIPQDFVKGKRWENVLAAFTAVEEGDDESVVAQAVPQVMKHFHEVKAANLLIYPYAHLSSNLAKPELAKKLLNELLQECRKHVPSADKTVFGYYKEFELKCKGHPLAELSKSFSPKQLSKKAAEFLAREETVAGGDSVSDSIKQEARVKSEFFILDVDGTLTPAEKYNYKNNAPLKALADYEIKKVRSYAEEPPHVKLMKELHLVAYEPASDSSNMRWMPKGLLIKRLLEKAATDICVNYGALQVETPIMYDFEHTALKSYLNRFPARQYVVKSDEKEYFLRFSACFGEFLAAHDLTISYRQLPLPIYEITHYSFRREQSGELVGLKRLRAFTMPDMHTLCADFDQAKKEFEKQYHLCLEWNQDLEIPFEIAFRVQRDFFNENKDWYVRMVKKIGKAILVEIFDLRYAYFITKFEFNFIDNAMKAAGLSTVQIDVENGERFDMAFTDEKGKKQYPLVLHASIPGAIDRVVFALLEREASKIKQGKKPSFPLWLSPTQVRVIPVSADHHEFCEKLLEEMKKYRIRIDFDDREETFQSKIRDAEKEWIPFIAVIGNREVKSGELSVRAREKGKQEVTTPQTLAIRIEKESESKPFERLSLSNHLTKRPIF